MARGWTPTDDEVNKAKGVLEAAYRRWVSDLVEELIFETFTEDISEDDLRERIDERTDSGLVYTHDQWTALFASRNTGEAWDELRDMGSTDTEDPVGPWAVLTYRQDVNNDLWQDALISPLQEGLNLEERVQWLIEEHGGHEYPLGRARAYIIGTVNDIGFGILIVPDSGDHEFLGRHLDDGGLRVLMDMILETGGEYDSAQVRNFLSKSRRSA
jgi:hypothetical protein